jgi:hypothetical protein
MQPVSIGFVMCIQIFGRVNRVGHGPQQPHNAEVTDRHDKTPNIIVVRISELRQRLRNIRKNRDVKLQDSQIVICCSQTYTEES